MMTSHHRAVISVCVLAFALSSAAAANEASRKLLQNYGSGYGYQSPYEQSDYTPPRRCAKDPTPYCGNGYTLEGYKCVKTEYKPAEYACAYPYTYEDGRCYNEDWYDAVVECVYPNTLEDGQCCYSDETAFELKCAYPYTLTRGKCVYEQTTDYVYTCKYGELYDGRCRAPNSDGYGGYTYVYTEATRSCPPGGYEYDNAKNTCVKNEEEYPAEECPPGYKISSSGYDKKCTKTECAYPEYKCAQSDYTLRDKRCYKQVYNDATYSCSSPYKLRGNECYYEDSKDAQYKCTYEGYTYEDGECYGPC